MADEMVMVRPARDANGSPKVVPRRRLGVLVWKGGEWPSEAVKPDGELLRLDRYVKRLLLKRDLERVEEGAGSEPAEETGDKPAGRKRKQKPEGE